jgi:hypothetical protein
VDGRSGLVGSLQAAILLTGILSALSAAGNDPAPGVAGADSAAARDSMAAVDTTTVLFADSVVFVDLEHLDIDEALRGGKGVILAFEDTIPFDKGRIDTVFSRARRVRVAEVVRKIGERMERDRARMREHSYLGILTAVAYDGDPEAPDPDRTVFESISRYRLDPDGTYQEVRLWQRERKFESGELTKDELDEDVESQWGEYGGAVMEALPFSLQGGDDYRYAITGRHLAGTNIIYEVHFEPRNLFAALPSGKVWIDFSDFVIRRFEGEMTGAVPLPLFLKAVPEYRMRRVQKGVWWVVDDIYARVKLRSIPLLGLPGTVDLYFRTAGHVIDGRAFPDTTVLPLQLIDREAFAAALARERQGQERAEQGAGGPAGAETPTGLEDWITPEAAQDSLDAFWRHIDTGWLESAPAEVLASPLPDARLDSLQVVGDREVQQILTGSNWQLSYSPLALTTFNRAEGLRPGLMARLHELGRHRPELWFGGGYGIASEQAVWDGGFRLPLASMREVDDQGLPAGPSWTALSLTVRGGRFVERFAGDGRRVRALTGFLYGEDPNSYYERRGGWADLQLRPLRWLSLTTGLGRQQDRSLPVATSWNLLGDRDDVCGNLAIAGLEAWSAKAGLDLSWNRWRLGASVVWYRVDGGGLLDRLADGDAGAGGDVPGDGSPPGDPPDEADFRSFQVSLSGSILTGGGHEIVLRGGWRAMDRPAPLEWKTYLGDYPHLRGHEAATLAGDLAGWASLDVRWGFDLFRSLHVPFLRRLGLQPITFFDWGRTLGQDGPGEAALRSPLGTAGSRADAGLGFGRLIGIPGRAGEMRLYVGHPVLDGSEGDWRVLLVLED